MKTLSYKDKNGNKQPIGVFKIETPVVVQTTGTSTEEVMSQKAVTDALEDKADRGDVYTKEEINNKLENIDFSNLATLEDISEFIDNVEYNSETGYIEFYHGETVIASVSRDEILGDAIKDGMLDNVELIGNDLVFTFNTDADKTAIRVSLTDFLNPELFAKKEEVYTKEETNQQIENALCEDPANGYEYIDMGEAGIWAKYPIGVTEWNEEALDKVKYFEWGGIEGYTKSQVGVEKQFSNNFTDYRFSGEGATGYENPQLTKYCYDASYGKNGFTDKLTVLLPEDDACVQNMGGNWRMPTTEEYENLYDLCYNNYVTNYNDIIGLNGRLFKLKTDKSKQLFFPIFGISGQVQGIDQTGSFWSSSLNDFRPSFGQEAYFGSDDDNPSSNKFRCFGCPIVGFISSLPNKEEKYLSKKEASETYATKEELDDINIPEVDLSKYSDVYEVEVDSGYNLITSKEELSDLFYKLEQSTNPIVVLKSEFSERRVFPCLRTYSGFTNTKVFSFYYDAIENGTTDQRCAIFLRVAPLSNVGGSTTGVYNYQYVTNADFAPIQSKLEGVEKVADDSKVIKSILLSKQPNPILPDTSGRLMVVGDDNISLTDLSGHGLSIAVNTDKIATIEYVDSIKTSILGSEELNESYDTLQEVAEWIESHSDEAADIINKQNAIERWKETIKTANQYIGSLSSTHTADDVSITSTKYNLTSDIPFVPDTELTINPATSEKAGVMSATDKIKLDSIAERNIQAKLISNNVTTINDFAYLDIDFNSLESNTAYNINDFNCDCYELRLNKPRRSQLNYIQIVNNSDISINLIVPKNNSKIILDVNDEYIDYSSNRSVISLRSKQALRFSNITFNSSNEPYIIFTYTIGNIDTSNANHVKQVKIEYPDYSTITLNESYTKNIANGICGLNSEGKVDEDKLPNFIKSIERIESGNVTLNLDEEGIEEGETRVYYYSKRDFNSQQTTSFVTIESSESILRENLEQNENSIPFSSVMIARITVYHSNIGFVVEHKSFYQL